MPISCKTLITVVPCATKPRTSDSQSAWCGGSRLDSGSSISSTSACTASARASSTRWRSPPESCPSALPRQSQAWVARRACSTAAWSAALGGPSQVWCGRRPSITRSCTSRSSPPVSFWPNQDSCCARARCAQPAKGWPSKCTSPRCGSRPASAFSRVDLPAPLGPTTLVQRPRGSARSMLCSTSAVPRRTLKARACSAAMGTRTCSAGSGRPSG